MACGNTMSGAAMPSCVDPAADCGAVTADPITCADPSACAELLCLRLPHNLYRSPYMCVGATQTPSQTLEAKPKESANGNFVSSYRRARRWTGASRRSCASCLGSESRSHRPLRRRMDLGRCLGMGGGEGGQGVYPGVEASTRVGGATVGGWATAPHSEAPMSP